MAKVEQEAEREARAAIEEIARDRAIQEQLARLRVRPAARGKEQYGNVDVEEGEDDVEEEESLIKQLMAEARLDQDLGGGVSLPSRGPTGGPSGATAGEPEELPWCVICNEDALVRLKLPFNIQFCLWWLFIPDYPGALGAMEIFTA